MKIAICTAIILSCIIFLAFSLISEIDDKRHLYETSCCVALAASTKISTGNADRLIFPDEDNQNEMDLFYSGMILGSIIPLADLVDSEPRAQKLLNNKYTPDYNSDYIIQKFETMKRE